jgi:hypothetical protein
MNVAALLSSLSHDFGLTVLSDLSASSPSIISLRSFEIWLVVKADRRDPSDSEVSGLCFNFFLMLDVLLEN